MASTHPDIKPNGLNQRELVSVVCMLLRSLQSICQALDDDASVPEGGGAGAGSEEYEALVITALLNLSVQDAFGNRFSNGAAGSSILEEHHVIEPTGISDSALLAFMYQFTNAFETLCEKLDADTLTSSAYESTCYTPTFLHIIENEKGNQVGNGTAFYFRPGGVNPPELVDWLYNATYALSLLTALIDADATVTLTTYTALYYTAMILMRIENSAGSVIGNDSPYM